MLIPNNKDLYLMDVKFGKFALSFKKPDSVEQKNNVSVQNPYFGNSFAKPPIEKDTFTKQTSAGLSFCGAGLNSDFFGFMEGFLDSMVSSYFEDIYDEVSKRTSVNTFLNEMIPLTKQMGGAASFRMDEITGIVFGDEPYFDKTKKYIDKLFADANINSSLTLKRFLNIYSNASKKYPEMSSSGPEALKIYSKLETKEDLQNFPEILLYLESESETLSKEIDLNKCPAFIKKLGIKDEKEFFNKFSHLKSAFNDFEETQDKLDAISYVQSTYDAKIKILNGVIASNPELRGEKAEKLYLKATEIVDFIYDKDPAKADEKLNKILALAIKESKISARTKSKIETFEDISTTDKRVEFLEFLSYEGIAIEELNELFTTDTAFIDDDYEAMLLKRNIIVDGIAEIKNLSVADAKKYYSQYKEILNAVSESNMDEDLPFGIQAAVDVIDKFGIKNSKDFANVYSSIFLTSGPSKKSGAKNKKQSFTPMVKLRPEQVTEVIKILNFADKDIAAKFRSDKKFPLLEELKARKQEFETLLPEIQEFLYANENPVFSGKLPFEIFMDYKKLASSGEDFKTFVSNVEMFETTDALDYSNYSGIYNDFAQYFPDKKTTNAFLAKNGIKFDSSHESSAHRQNCLKILSALDKEEDSEYFEKLLHNDFIKNSKTELSSFLSKTGKKVDLNTAIKTILDKNIQSFSDIRQIIRLYADDKGKYDKVLEHFRNTPDNVGLNEYLAVLNKIQNAFTSGGIPIKINNDNISAIGNEYFNNDCKISQYKTICLANKMSSQKTDGNFIASLEKAFGDKSASVSAYAIAVEIVNRAAKNSESYQNILRELHINVHREGELSDNATKAEYIYAVAKALPQEFVDFVNDSKWTDFMGDNKYPHMKLHAKMRLIDRFVLNEEGSIKKLHTKETEEKLKDVLRIVYTNAPSKLIKCNKDKDRFEAQFDYGKDNKINAVFCSTGEMITIVKY